MMLMYRRVQDYQRMMVDIQRELRDAILADNTRDMGQRAGTAHGLMENLMRGLEQLLSQIQGGPKQERIMVQAARDSAESAIVEAQKVALGTNVEQMRAWLLNFKTRADFVDAYLHAALGFERE